MSFSFPIDGDAASEEAIGCPLDFTADFLIMPSISISLSDTIAPLPLETRNFVVGVNPTLPCCYSRSSSSSLSSSSSSFSCPSFSPLKRTSIFAFSPNEKNGEERENLNGKDDGSSSDENQAALMTKALLPPSEPRTTEESNGPRSTKKRHTPEQIIRLEEVFRECCHPSDRQRLSLSQELGLTPGQVKFWFQNRRNQLKNRHERESNIHLRAVNERLKDVNYGLKASMCNATCGTCGRPTVVRLPSEEEMRLMRENAWLKGEVDKISFFLRSRGILLAQPMLPTVPGPPQNTDTGFYPPYPGGADF